MTFDLIRFDFDLDSQLLAPGCFRFLFYLILFRCIRILPAANPIAVNFDQCDDSTYHSKIQSFSCRYHFLVRPAYFLLVTLQRNLTLELHSNCLKMGDLRWTSNNLQRQNCPQKRRLLERKGEISVYAFTLNAYF